jgi:uncharacterized protein
MASRDYQSVWFIWHGGEPLELPFSFWKKAMELQDRYFGEHRVGNTIQTNGVNLDRRTIDYCRKRMINIGVSHEGPCDGILRKDCAKVDSMIRKMSSGERVFSVSSTIPAGAEGRQKEIYDYFSDIGTAVSMVPVIPAGCAAGRRDLVPDTDLFIKSSIDAFDAWLNDRDAKMPLSPHFFYVLSALGDPQPADCAHNSCLTRWICVYPNGDVYPCGKACPEEYRLGNIMEVESISDLFKTEGFRTILIDSVERRNTCKDCEIYDKCMGGCTIDAYYEGDPQEAGGFSCVTYKAIYSHIDAFLKDIIDNERDLSKYNRYIRDSIIGKLTNPNIITPM